MLCRGDEGRFDCIHTQPGALMQSSGPFKRGSYHQGGLSRPNKIGLGPDQIKPLLDQTQTSKVQVGSRQIGYVSSIT